MRKLYDRSKQAGAREPCQARPLVFEHEALEKRARYRRHGRPFQPRASHREAGDGRLSSGDITRLADLDQGLLNPRISHPLLFATPILPPDQWRVGQRPAMVRVHFFRAAM